MARVPMQELWSQELEKGVSCLHAGALDEAREAGSSFDVAIVDQEMPGTDGSELVRRMRQTPGTAGLPALLLCAGCVFDPSKSQLGCLTPFLWLFVAPPVFLPAVLVKGVVELALASRR